jgi:pimeloyl-ACP methyl ester carboxylesterase
LIPPIAPYLGGGKNSALDLTELDDLNHACENRLISVHNNTEHDPCVIADLFTLGNAKAGHRLAEIPVEKITCPLLLLSGDQDAIWPANYYCQAMINRLRAHGATSYYKHINYEMPAMA